MTLLQDNQDEIYLEELVRLILKTEALPNIKNIHNNLFCSIFGMRSVCNTKGITILDSNIDYNYFKSLIMKLLNERSESELDIESSDTHLKNKLNRIKENTLFDYFEDYKQIIDEETTRRKQSNLPIVNLNKDQFYDKYIIQEANEKIKELSLKETKSLVQIIIVDNRRRQSLFETYNELELI